MAAADQIMDNLRVQLPGAVDGAIQLQLWNVIDEFCRTTKAWTAVLEIPLEIGVSSYNLTVDDGKILEVISMAHEQLGLTDAIYDGAGNIDVAALPSAADTATELFVTVALTLNGDSTEAVEDWAPDDFLANHMHAFIDGTLGRMMSQIAKPYSSPQMALFHMRRFRNAMAGARTYVLHGGVSDAQAWRFPRWV
jgi:hypothetical protein